MRIFIFTNGIQTQPVKAANIKAAWEALSYLVGNINGWQLQGQQG